MHLGITAKGSVIIIIPFLFQLAFIGLLVKGMREAEEAAREMSRARMVAGYAAATMDLAASNTTVAAGYALSLNPRYLQYFKISRETLKETLATLERLIVDRRERSVFEDFRTKVHTLTDVSEKMVLLIEKGKAHEAATQFQSPDTDKLWISTRMAGGRLVSLETNASMNVEQMLSSARTSLGNTVITGVVADSVLMLILLIFFSHDITRRLKIMIDNAKRFAQTQPLNSPVTGTDEISQLDTVFHDMTVVVTEAARREKAVLEYAVDVICSIDESGCFGALNPAAEKIWGYEGTTLRGRKFPEIISPSFRESAWAAFEHARSQNESVAFEVEIVTASGSFRDSEWVAYWSPVDKSLFCVAHDITERKRVEQILRENEARMRAILENMLVGVFVSDVNGLIEIANPRTEEMFGCTIDDLCGHPVTSFLCGSLKDSMTDPAVFLQNAKRRVTEVEARRHSGEFFPAEVTVSEFNTFEGKRLLTNVLDVSERKEVERVRREFVAIVSHDLRTPLAGIVGGLNLLSEGACGELPDKALDILKLSERSACRLMSLINDLLDIEKLEAGMSILQIDEVNLSQLLQHAIADVETIANRSHMRIEADPCQGTVLADRDAIIRVLINLVSNAIKFSPAGSTIKVEVKQLPDFFEVGIVDQGRGIPEHFRPLLFQKFQQSELGDSKKGGSGLGLAICKAIIEQHQGTIGVDSVVGEGSRFWFRLPSAHPGEGAPDC